MLPERRISLAKTTHSENARPPSGDILFGKHRRGRRRRSIRVELQRTMRKILSQRSASWMVAETDRRKNLVFVFLLLPANRRCAFIFLRAANSRIALRTPYTDESLYRTTTTTTSQPVPAFTTTTFARISFFARRPFFLCVLLLS